jgi:hypothetical protein
VVTAVYAIEVSCSSDGAAGRASGAARVATGQKRRHLDPVASAQRACPHPPRRRERTAVDAPASLGDAVLRCGGGMGSPELPFASSSAAGERHATVVEGRGGGRAAAVGEWDTGREGHEGRESRDGLGCRTCGRTPLVAREFSFGQFGGRR